MRYLKAFLVAKLESICTFMNMPFLQNTIETLGGGEPDMGADI